MKKKLGQQEKRVDCFLIMLWTFPLMHPPSFPSLNKTTGTLSLHIEDYISTMHSAPARHSASHSTLWLAFWRLSCFCYFMEILSQRQIERDRNQKRVRETEGEREIQKTH